MIPDQYTYELGEFKEERIFHHITVIPSWNDPEKFVVEVYYKELMTPEFEEVKHTIVRIDNKSHGDSHMDQLYKEEPDKDFTRDWSAYSAWRHLEKKWRSYANKYFRNHVSSEQ